MIKTSSQKAQITAQHIGGINYQPPPACRGDMAGEGTISDIMLFAQELFSLRRQISNRQQMSAYSDIERTEVCSNSKLSEISSSTAYSARSAGSKGR